jgi:hypothetical protein
VSRRGRIWFLAASLAVFGLLAAFTIWAAPDTGPPDKTPATVTLAPGATRPAGLAVADLDGVDQLRDRFNQDQGQGPGVLSICPIVR